MIVGIHTRTDDPIAEAEEHGADAVQSFLGDPQSWKAPPPHPQSDDIVASDIRFYVHAPYPSNLGSPNNRIRIPSRKTIAGVATAAEELGAAGLIVHGGHIGDDEEAAVGLERWRKALNSFETSVPILIENTAGGGNAIVREIERYGPLWEEIGDRNVGVCLDTCHAWSAGEDLDTVVDRLVALTGRIDLVHCNDSRDPLGSSRDRHASLGQGDIPDELLVGVVKAAGAPVIIETPTAGDDVAWLRERL